MVKVKFNKGLPTPIANSESIFKLSTRFSSSPPQFNLLQKLGQPYPHRSAFEKMAAWTKLPLKKLGLFN
jgi:hypothetical protein